MALLFAVSANASQAEGNPAEAEQRLRAGMQEMLVDLANKGELVDGSGAPKNFNISEPAREVDNLGVVISGNDSDGAGLAIVAVTPGGAAARMGVHSGDRLAAVNDTGLTDLGRDAGNQSRAVAVMRTEIAKIGDGGKIRLTVDRDGRRISFEGRLQRLQLPSLQLSVGDGVQVASTAGVSDESAAGCGRINEFDVAPRQKQLHRAQLIFIDGNSPGPSGSPSFRLSAGRHTLTVAEEIEDRYLSFNNRLRNSSSDRYKKIEVDVKPNTTYYLAARLNEDKVGQWRDGAYWDPALWLEKTERCTP
ncbi:MAG: PDZ domain-containing protein [Dokdonella sp.]